MDNWKSADVIRKHHISEWQVFDSNGAFVFKFGSRGDGDGQFKNPYSVAVDSNDNLLVTDACQRTGRCDVQRFACVNG